VTKARQAHISEQFDLFLPYISDLPLRDQREMMERPFFSLAKSKRVKPIDYNSPDGKLWVHVSANPDYGMATIWDADILIYCASTLADMARRGVNDVPRKLHLMPYDLLRAIGRPTTGRAYELLAQSLDRLVSTTVKTNIRAENRREATFSWLDGWTQLVDEKTERSRGMTLELSNWFHEGVLMQGGILSIDRAYFDISGGRERWLYKVARKHAGGAGEAGFAISLPTLFEKSGAEGQYRRFKFEIAKIAERNELPGYSIAIEQAPGKREPSLRMRRRSEADTEQTSRPKKGGAQRRSEPKGAAKALNANPTTAAPSPQDGAPDLLDVRSMVRRTVTTLSSKATEGFITDATLQTLRGECPGWDYQNLHLLFREWIDGDPSRTPVNYQNAFIGFVRRYDKENRHTLRN
jgi:plasmid replication initiation protein